MTTHEQREAFIANYRIMSIRGTLYGPDDLLNAWSRDFRRSICAAFKYPQRECRDHAKALIADAAWMRMRAGCTPGAIVRDLDNDVWGRVFHARQRKAS